MKLNKRRTALEVLKAILDIGPATRTDIRIAVGMNYGQAERYLAFLAGGGYMDSQEFERTTRYLITDKGHKLLGLLDELAALVDSEEELVPVGMNGHRSSR